LYFILLRLGLKNKLKSRKPINILDN
jgi:hypothetical protein